MSAAVECSKPGEVRQSIRRFEVVDSCSIGFAKGREGRIDLWYPIIPDSPYQRVLDVAISGPWRWGQHREQEHGNLMLHAESSPVTEGEPRFDIHYVVERTPVAHALHPACVRPLETPALFERWLRAEQFVDVNHKTRALAGEIAGEATNVLDRARLIYDYVAGAMTYDAELQSWKGSTEHALVCSTGNCNDIHALFISLCRSLGIPARLILGQALETPTAGTGAEACELCGYHCWAEFFASGLGWIPVDASCACKYGKHELFGDLEMNHIAWSVGRDIALDPPQKDERLLFFAGPYAEVDGVACRVARRHIRFAEI